MKLLKVSFDHLRMFENGLFEIDLFASDKVPAGDESAFSLAGTLYTNNIIGLAGINASGKTTALVLLELAGKIIQGASIFGGGIPSTIATFFDSRFTFKCLAYEGNSCYLVESQIACEQNTTTGSVSFNFVEEQIFSIPAKLLKRSDLQSWESISAAAHSLCVRTQALESMAVLASSEVSIAGAVIAKDTKSQCGMQILREDNFTLRYGFDGLDTVLHVFDPTIEHLEVADEGRAFSAKFKGRDAMILSEQGLNEVLSSGTYRGVALVSRAITTLKFGGYLLVDEIENHLNRQLVNVVLEIFASKNTNPKGATLVFTTHYPQLLDCVHRKDNIYFLASTYGCGSKVVKYCDHVKRIENKKSEVFVSNYIKGTAPRYVDVKSLKEMIAQKAVGND